MFKNSDVSKTAAPSAPIITSIAFDSIAGNPPTYNVGDLMTATVTYIPGTSASVQTFTGTAKDSATGKTGTLTVNFDVVVKDTTSVSASDTANRTWTLKSDTGTVAVFTATA